MKLNKTRTLTLLTLAVILFSSCNSQVKIDIEQEKVDLLSTDIAFSDLSEKKGFSEAFTAFGTNTSIMLKKESRPIEGKFNLEQHYKTRSDSGFVLKWRPIKATVSKAGDIGFTYGVYEYISNEAKMIGKGTYVTIWEKQKDGTWKWILDCGNEGLEKKQIIEMSDSIDTKEIVNG